MRTERLVSIAASEPGHLVAKTNTQIAYLALAALRVNPTLLIHEPTASLEVLLDGRVLNGLESDLHKKTLHLRR